MKVTAKKKIIALAPMAGITDAAFRRICQEHSADFTFSEMISVASVFFHPGPKNKSWRLASSFPSSEPFFVQLFGSQPEQFALAAEKFSSLPKRKKNEKNSFGIFRPDGIDINFGCPAKKVLKQNSGCALMKNPQLAKKIISATLENTDLPVSLKIRAGIENFSALDFLQAIGDLDWKILTVHGRTFSQGFSGEIDFELIRKIKKMFPKKIVLANGGIFSPPKARETLEKTGADGIMIGRGAMGQPWIFSQIKKYLEKGKFFQPTSKQIRKTILLHARYFFSDPRNNPAEFRKHLLWYSKGRPQAKKWRDKIIRIESLKEVEELF